MNESKSRVWIAIARVVAGAVFIHNALPRMNASFLLGFDRQVAAWANGNPFPWFQLFLTNVVAPNEQVFALAVMVLELLVGIALLIGFLTGLASLLGMLLTVALLLASSHLSAPTGGLTWAFAPNIFSLLVLLMLLVLKAGRFYGLDSRMGTSKGLLW